MLLVAELALLAEDFFDFLPFDEEAEAIAALLLYASAANSWVLK